VTPALSQAVALCRTCRMRLYTGALNLFVVLTVAPQHDRETNTKDNTCNVFSIMLYYSRTNDVRHNA
jgi:hypothetical protein